MTCMQVQHCLAAKGLSGVAGVSIHVAGSHRLGLHEPEVIHSDCQGNGRDVFHSRISLCVAVALLKCCVRDDMSCSHIIPPCLPCSFALFNCNLITYRTLIVPLSSLLRTTSTWSLCAPLMSIPLTSSRSLRPSSKKWRIR